jgi:hypothetical protein
MRACAGRVRQQVKRHGDELARPEGKPEAGIRRGAALLPGASRVIPRGPRASAHISASTIRAYGDGWRVPTRPTVADIEAVTEMATGGALLKLFSSAEPVFA